MAVVATDLSKWTVMIQQGHSAALWHRAATSHILSVNSEWGLEQMNVALSGKLLRVDGLQVAGLQSLWRGSPSGLQFSSPHFLTNVACCHCSRARGLLCFNQRGEVEGSPIWWQQAVPQPMSFHCQLADTRQQRFHSAFQGMGHLTHFTIISSQLIPICMVSLHSSIKAARTGRLNSSVSLI